MRKPIPEARIGALVAVALACPTAGGLSAQQLPEPQPSIHVQGTAEVRVPADRARLTFMVETQAATAEAAVRQNAERMDRVMRALREAGGATVSVETGGYQLSPIYSRPSRTEPDVPTIQAYRAVNNVRVRADDVTRVGGLIDAATGAGANRMTALGFEAKDTEPARLEAVRQAVAKARAEAEAAAGALGVALGPPQDVSVGMDYPVQIVQRREIAFDMAMAQEAPTPIEPGEQVVRANVSIRYRIGP